MSAYNRVVTTEWLQTNVYKKLKKAMVEEDNKNSLVLMVSKHRGNCPFDGCERMATNDWLQASGYKRVATSE